MFRKEENRCEDILREIAEKHGIESVDISVMPDAGSHPSDSGHPSHYECV